MEMFTSVQPNRMRGPVQHGSALRQMTRLGVTILSGALLMACDGHKNAVTPQSNHDSTSTASSDRIWRAAKFDTLWMVGGPQGDSLFARPAEVRTYGDQVLVPDEGRNHVVSIRASDGHVNWISDRSAEDSVLNQPYMTARGYGDVLAYVMESGAGGTVRALALGRTGKVLPARSTGALATARFSLNNALCTFSPNELLLADASVDGKALGTFNIRSGSRDVVDPPFPDQASKDVLQLASIMVEGIEKQSCIVAWSQGYGLAKWKDGRFTAFERYVENVPTPGDPVEERTVDTVEIENGQVITETIDAHLPRSTFGAAIAVTVEPGNVRVLFGGMTSDRGRIVDDYDATTLEYKSSVLLPFKASSITALGSGVLVLLTRKDGYYVVIAVKERAI